ncbi:hypothetical protein HK100_001042 [Physocladia obscura]|uniref:Uncharacterized protein n=1 Tax=Physocladia obscura TaxID=109957 RepID=A0AAD5XC39_9FUNG|nr:hypothetical protein HK100_001042 [Physocladia obscura]
MAQEQQQSQTSQQQNQQKQLQIQQHQQLKKPQQAQHQQYLKPGKDNQEQVAAVLITAASNNIDENNSTIMRTDGMSNGKFVSDSKAPAATILAVKEGSYSRDGGKNEENENNAETDTVSVPVSVPRKKIGTTAAASAAVAGASRASNNNIATALGDDSEISVTLDALDLEM